MSEVRLVIRDADHDLHAECHVRFADAVVAALSAEPESINELETALDRFIERGEVSHFHGFRQGIDDRGHDAGVMIIDLAARLIVCESSYSKPEHSGCVSYHDGRQETDLPVEFHLHEDWEIRGEVACWRSLADERRRRRAASPPLDVRAVLYGEPLLAFIAARGVAAFHDRPIDLGADGEDVDDAQADDDAERVREIHRDWLMTARSDLRGQTPRQAMMAQRSFMDRSLQDRSHQWSLMRRRPPTLAPDSAAYRFAGFGTHELVMYYELVRALLWSCRDAVATAVLSAGGGAVDEAAFVARETDRLATVREAWLNEPDPEFGGRTPRSIIHNERVRLPEVARAHDHPFDDDCPLCQMMRDDSFGPTFWHLDGCEMDDEFAFSISHDTLEEWEQEQREHEQWMRQFEAREAERERLGVKYPGEGYGDPNIVWRRSFSVKMSANEALPLRLFTIGSHLAELTADLKEPTQDAASIDRLSGAFANLRQVTQSREQAAPEALLQPVIDRFCKALDAVAETRPDLAPKCEDLQDRLRRFGAPGDLEDVDEIYDDDIPF